MQTNSHMIPPNGLIEMVMDMGIILTEITLMNFLMILTNGRIRIMMVSVIMQISMIRGMGRLKLQSQNILGMVILRDSLKLVHATHFLILLSMLTTIKVKIGILLVQLKVKFFMMPKPLIILFIF